MMPLTPNTLPTKGNEAYIFTDLQKLLRGQVFDNTVTWPQVLSGTATLTTTDDHVGVMDIVGPENVIIFDPRIAQPGTWQSRSLMIRVASGVRATMLCTANTDGAITDQVHVILSTGAAMRVINIQAGSVTARADWRVDLSGAGARVDFTGLQMLSSPAHADISMVIDHQTPDTISTQTIRSVVGANGTGVFQGKIQVAPHAVRTHATQNAKAILLAPSAVMNIKPELEIYADDVVCSHGATVGALDADQIFYLASRGVPPGVARQILIHAFLNGAVPDLPDTLAAHVYHILGGDNT